jgi:hypothetical protein
MLLYFNDEFRVEAIQQLGTMAREEGLLIFGTDWANTMECRYFTYRKQDGKIQKPEFAFSLDNLVPLAIVPWYTLHDDDREVHMLATLVEIIRADRAFLDRFLSHSDALRDEYGICPRQPDGYYGEMRSDLPASEFWNLAGRICDRLGENGMDERAVAVLNRAGWQARVNEVGHIAVKLF